VLYALFISGLFSGEMFPTTVVDEGIVPEDFKAIFHQHANGQAEYAKLFFWVFRAGFNRSMSSASSTPLKAGRPVATGLPETTWLHQRTS
jgi:hypothetical protein